MTGRKIVAGLQSSVFGTLALIRGGSDVKTAPLGNTGSWRVDGAVLGKARVCKKVFFVGISTGVWSLPVLVASNISFPLFDRRRVPRLTDVITPP
jgi:hypothetical protein